MIDRYDQNHNFGFYAEESKHITLWHRNMKADFLKYFKYSDGFVIGYLQNENVRHTYDILQND